MTVLSRLPRFNIKPSFVFAHAAESKSCKGTYGRDGQFIKNKGTASGGKGCRHDFTAVTSVDDVYRGSGDVYYLDRDTGHVYVRLLRQQVGYLDYTQSGGFRKMGASQECD